jgi:hypothetical protein
MQLVNHLGEVDLLDKQTAIFLQGLHLLNFSQSQDKIQRIRSDSDKKEKMVSPCRALGVVGRSNLNPRMSFSSFLRLTFIPSTQVEDMYFFTKLN